MVRFAEGFSFLFLFMVGTNESNVKHVVGRNLSLKLLCRKRYMRYDRWQNLSFQSFLTVIVWKRRSSVELKFLIKITFVEKENSYRF